MTTNLKLFWVKVDDIIESQAQPIIVDITKYGFMTINIGIAKYIVKETLKPKFDYTSIDDIIIKNDKKEILPPSQIINFVSDDTFNATIDIGSEVIGTTDQNPYFIEAPKQVIRRGTVELNRLDNEKV